MEFTALNGSEIKNLEIETGCIRFTTNLFDREAKIEITGIETITPDLVEGIIENVEIDVIDIYEDTFSKVEIETEDNTFVLEGNMKGTLLNEEDFQDLIDEMWDNEFDNAEEDEYEDGICDECGEEKYECVCDRW